jgi:hypothetical protein
MATIKDLANRYGLEDYEQLLGGYPNAEKFITGLKDAAVRAVPTTDQMRDPNFIIDTAGLGGAIKAYHGTPHLFDRFDMSKLGTGEGAQSYGHGLYFAQNPNIAESYRKKLSDAEYKTKRGGDLPYGWKSSINEMRRNGKSHEDVVNFLQGIAEKQTHPNWKAAKKLNERIQKGNVVYSDPGRIYETSIQWPNAEREAMDPLGEHHLLDWDQPAEGYVQEAIPRKIRELQNARDAISSKYVDDEFNPDDLFSNTYSFPSNEDKAAMDRIAEEIVMHKNMSPAFEKGAEGSVTYSKLVKMLGSPEKASEYLHSLDIPGIKYLDATSRSTDKGTRNFVTFGDEYPQIVKRAGSLDELQEKNLNKRLIEKYLSEGKLSPDDMAQYEQNALAMETPLLQRYNVENALANPNREAYKNEFDDQDYYHGTSHDFKSFKPSEYGRLNEGVYVTPDKTVANMFSKISGSKRSGESANTMPLKINPKNVYTYENYGDIPLAGTNNEYFKQKGIDALAVKDKEMALFDPSMIRSRFAAFDPLRKNSSSIMASGLLGDLALKYANDDEPKYAEGGIVDKLKSQDFGPNDSVIISSLMHPQEAAGKAGDWLQEKMRIASGRPYEDNFTPDQQAQAGLDLAGLMQTGAMPFAPASAGGTLGTFIGPKSRNWDKVAAELAAKKLDEGADPAEVWREHLIGRMPDKTLFSEISDDEMSHVIPLNKWVNRENGQFMAPNISTAWDEAASTLTPNAPVRIKRLFNHEQLKNEYPYGFTKNYENQSIMDMPVFMHEKNSQSFGSLGDGDLALHPSLLPKQAKSTVLHELQHAIQNEEGWGQGGNLDSAASFYIENYLSPKLKELNNSINEGTKLRGNITNEDEYAENVLRHKQLVAERDKINDEVSNIENNQAPKLRLYNRLAGEAQARATQDRLDMDMAQRRENYPLAGGKLSDIPLEELIYKYEGNGPSLSADPLSKYKDYVGEHSAPLGDSGAPLHDLTANENAIYPSDVYSSQANQYYGSGEPEDAQLFAMAQRLKDKPNEKVTIYRAVPKVQSNSEKAAQLEKDLANYMKRGRMPRNSDFNNKSDWYEWASNERDRLASLPEETLDPLSINHGDWVALDKKYAKEHGKSALGGNYKILSKKVPARQLFTNGDSIREWGWDSRYAEGGSVSMEDLPFDDPDQLRLYHQAMKHYDDVIENTGGSKKMGKTEARINYNTTTKGDRDRDKDLHTLIADYGIDVGKDAKINATMIKPMEAEGVYLGNLTGSVPVGEGRASLGLQGLHTKYSDGLSGYTAGYSGKVGDGDLSASYFEPADHNSAGRQVQLEYSMPFADGGSVSEFEDPAHERLYRRAMAHFDDMSAKQNFEDDDSMIASTILHPVEAAKRAGSAFMRSVDTAGGRPKKALDESSWYPVGIAPSMDEQTQAALDLAGLAQTGAMPFAPESAGGVLGMLIKPMKASEAYGRIEGQNLNALETDRTKVGKGFLGGVGYTGLQHTSPPHAEVDSTWGVQTPSKAATIINGTVKPGQPDPVFTTFIGSPDQHKSNNLVFDLVHKNWRKASKDSDLLTPELIERMNERLATHKDYVDRKTGKPLFPADINVLSKNLKDYATTFDRRAALAEVLGGKGVGGKKGQIFDYDKVIRDTTDPALLDVPSGSLGNRLFTLNGGILTDRYDLNPAFPTILQGKDFGLIYEPVPRELVFKDFVNDIRQKTGRDPGYMHWTRGYPPSQLITEDLLTEMQKAGYAKGGSVGLQELANKYM